MNTGTNLERNKGIKEQRNNGIKEKRNKEICTKTLSNGSGITRSPGLVLQ